MYDTLGSTTTVDCRMLLPERKHAQAVGSSPRANVTRKKKSKYVKTTRFGATLRRLAKILIIVKFCETSKPIVVFLVFLGLLLSQKTTYSGKYISHNDTLMPVSA